MGCIVGVEARREEPLVGCSIGGVECSVGGVGCSVGGVGCSVCGVGCSVCGVGCSVGCSAEVWSMAG